MGVADIMLGQVRSVLSVPNGQADSCRGSCFMRSMRDIVLGWDTLVRGTISKKHFSSVDFAPSGLLNFRNFAPLGILHR